LPQRIIKVLWGKFLSQQKRQCFSTFNPIYKYDVKKVVGIMVLNQATDYAMRMLLFLAKKDSGCFTGAASICAEELIPKKFLFKIMRNLTKVGMVKSVSGKDGGFMLVRKPEDITIYDVIEAVEGPIPLNKCLLDPNKCNKNATTHCTLRKELEKLRNDQIYRFQSINLKMLAEGA